MPNKIKNLIILLISIMVIIIIILVVIQNSLINEPESSKQEGETQEEHEDYESLQNDASTLLNGQKLEEVKSEGVYLTINRIIDKYIGYLNENNSEAIYQLLYDDYINKNNITTSNVLISLEKYNSYKISQMLGLSAVNYGIYYVKIDSNDKTLYLLINWDTSNNTFSICPINETQYNSGLQTGIDVSLERIASIKKNKYNFVTVWKTDNDSTARKYFYDFIELIVTKPEEVYSMLVPEYKNLNFPNYNDFAEYVNSNSKRFTSLDHNNFKTEQDFESDEEYDQYYQEVGKNKMTNYAQTSENGIKTYTFEDSYGKYYIFKVTAAMKYTVMLDTYSIGTEDFMNTYNSSSAIQKVLLNIQRFFMGINDKNYGYSYSVLSETFKNNNYPTKNDFINFVKGKFFDDNKINYISYEKENDLYIYNIKVTDATGVSNEERNFNIIMKLGNDINFEMSFGEV